MRVPILLCLAATLVVGCDDPDRTGLPQVDIPFDFGAVPDQANRDAGAPPQDLPPPDPAGPNILITTPKPNALVSGTSLVVQATVTTQKGEADIASVTLAASPGDPMQSPQTISMAQGKTLGMYTGTLDLTQNGTASMWIDVTAIDLSKHQNTATLNVLRDAGPVITVQSPTMMNYAGSAPIQFTVQDPFGLAAKNGGVSATVQGVAIEVTPQVGQKPPGWTGTIDFQSKAFMVPLMGLQAVEITATNVRGTTSAVDVQFTVDEQGPEIVILSPAVGAIVGGLITIEAQVDDISLVADQSVIAVIQDFDEMTMMPVDRIVPLMNEGVGMASTDKYSGNFDTSSLNPLFVYSNVSVRASDKLGNMSNVSEQVILDNVPPSLDLDPPSTRVRKVTLAGLECSHLFDPVGDDATNDGDIQAQEVWFRARADDQGNFAQGLVVEHPAGVDPTSLELYIIEASDAPLVVDTNGDTLCDDFNPKIAPTTDVMAPGQALKIPLIPLPPIGNVDYTMDKSLEFLADANGNPFCEQVGDGQAMPPAPLCNATPLTYAIPSSTGTAAIFVIAPIGAGNAGCVGLQADLLNKIPDGPACVAIRGSDLAGNRTVSKPLRICIDKFNKGICPNLYNVHGPGTTAAMGLPDCTGSVDVNGVVSATPCTPFVKLNTGKPVVPFPLPTEPLTVQ